GASGPPSIFTLRTRYSFPPPRALREDSSALVSAFGASRQAPPLAASEGASPSSPQAVNARTTTIVAGRPLRHIRGP
ncbi:MAG: hypothetical protein KY463_09350, partial [Actinobacteria bacterium]|nr:hypothetical protein [Actinomycetota bacterium]